MSEHEKVEGALDGHAFEVEPGAQSCTLCGGTASDHPEMQEAATMLLLRNRVADIAEKVDAVKYAAARAEAYAQGKADGVREGMRRAANTVAHMSCGCRSLILRSIRAAQAEPAQKEG